MITEYAEPSWLIEGGPVLLEQLGTNDKITKATIERLTKTLVIVSDGNRYNRKTLSRSYGGTWGQTVYLRDLADPNVLARAENLRKRNLRINTAHRFEDLMRDLRHGSDDDVVREAIALLQRAVDGGI